MALLIKAQKNNPTWVTFNSHLTLVVIQHARVTDHHSPPRESRKANRVGTKQKRKMTLKSIVIITITFAIIFSSCNDEAEQIQLENNQSTSDASIDVYMSNPLAFASADELTSFIEERQEIDLVKEAYRLAEEEEFYSLLYLYSLSEDELTALGYTTDDIVKVYSDDDMLLLMVDSKGEIIIEDYTYRIDGEYVFRYTEIGEEEIDSFKEAALEGDFVIEYDEPLEYSEHLVVVKHSNYLDWVADNGRRVSQAIPFNSNPRAQMIAEQFEEHWGFYSVIGAKTHVEEESRFLWWTSWSDVATFNALDVDASYFVFSFVRSNRTETIDTDIFCNTCNSARLIYEWSAAIHPIGLNYFTPLDGRTIHTAAWGNQVIPFAINY